MECARGQWQGARQLHQHTRRAAALVGPRARQGRRQRERPAAGECPAGDRRPRAQPHVCAEVRSCLSGLFPWCCLLSYKADETYRDSSTTIADLAEHVVAIMATESAWSGEVNPEADLRLFCLCAVGYWTARRLWSSCARCATWRRRSCGPPLPRASTPSPRSSRSPTLTCPASGAPSCPHSMLSSAGIHALLTQNGKSL